jgi:hypothetical protein
MEYNEDNRRQNLPRNWQKLKKCLYIYPPKISTNTSKDVLPLL